MKGAEKLTEGLFWLICQMDGGEIDWDEGWQLYHLFAKSDSISHKDAWAQIARREEKRFRRLAYSYYPRGRVVVRNGSATVFLSQHIATGEVLEAVKQVFGLDAPKVHAEGSRHYACFIDKKGM